MLKILTESLLSFHRFTLFPGSPALEADFESIQQRAVVISSSDAQSVVVSIIDDDFTENTETFSASLARSAVFLGGNELTLNAQELSRIIVRPDVATVEISDNDGTFAMKIRTLR